MISKEITNILKDFKLNKINEKEALRLIKDDFYNKNYLIGNSFKIDSKREARTNLQEVVFGEGKSKEQILAISLKIIKAKKDLLITRVNENIYQYLVAEFVVNKREEKLSFNKQARTVSYLVKRNKELLEKDICILTAGSSDLFVAEEVKISLEFFNYKSKVIWDVGVAGIERLFYYLKELEKASIIIVVAGMDGALPSVVAGLVKAPVIAVPTSIGYGSSFNGIASLLSMLNSCSPGIGVVNIDNGFGAACLVKKFLNKF